MRAAAGAVRLYMVARRLWVWVPCADIMVAQKESGRLHPSGMQPGFASSPRWYAFEKNAW